MWIGITSAQSARTLILDPGADIVAAAWVGKRLEVVDGGTRRLLEYDARGKRVSVTNIHLPIRLQAAARLRRGWMVGGAGIGGDVQLAVQHGRNFSIISAGGSLGSTRLANAPPDAESRELAAGEGFYLAPHGRDAALIAWVRRPHSVAVVPFRGSPFWLPPIPREKSRTMRPNDKGWYHWSAMPAVSISNGIVLQTVTDLGSSRRQLVVRGRDGAVARMTDIEVPMGLVGASPSGQIILAVLRDLTPVAVCYRVSQ